MKSRSIPRLPNLAVHSRFHGNACPRIKVGYWHCYYHRRDSPSHHFNQRAHWTKLVSKLFARPLPSLLCRSRAVKSSTHV